MNESDELTELRRTFHSRDLDGACAALAMHGVLSDVAGGPPITHPVQRIEA